METRRSRSLLDRLLDRLARSIAVAHNQELRAIRREIDELRNTLVSLEERTAAVGAAAKRIGKVLANQKNDEKYRTIFRKQLAALIRAQYFSTDVPAPLALQMRRFRLRSQNEEDGIILALLAATGVGSRRFIEIGSGGTGGNSAVLAYDMGWSGLMVDASKRAVRMAMHEFRPNPDVTVVRSLVTPDNVNELLRMHGLTGDVDLLSIDIDSVDYWVFDAISVCTARVAVVEYNAWFGPQKSITLPNATPPKNRPNQYFGASLGALTKAAARRGYRLVVCEDRGVNAFFVREGLAEGVPTLTPEQAFRPFRYRLRDEDPGEPTPDDVIRSIQAAGLELVEV
jgi:hypothetical protein